MKHGLKSTVSKLWNKCRDEELISKYVGLPVSEIVAYLQTRPGYPHGPVFRGPHHKTTRGRKIQRTVAAQYGRHGPAPAVTLPKLKCLGDA